MVENVVSETDFSLSLTRVPSPSQSWHISFALPTSPGPSCGQPSTHMVLCHRPRPTCRCVYTAPLPWHVPHVAGLAPARAPDPLQCPHVRSRSRFMTTLLPLYTSSSVTSYLTSVSGPREGFGRREGPEESNENLGPPKYPSSSSPSSKPEGPKPNMEAKRSSMDVGSGPPRGLSPDGPYRSYAALWPSVTLLAGRGDLPRRDLRALRMPVLSAGMSRVPKGHWGSTPSAFVVAADEAHLVLYVRSIVSA